MLLTFLLFDRSQFDLHMLLLFALLSFECLQSVSSFVCLFVHSSDVTAVDSNFSNFVHDCFCILLFSFLLLLHFFVDQGVMGQEQVWFLRRGFRWYGGARPLAVFWFEKIISSICCWNVVFRILCRYFNFENMHL
jgi:hypothetical protein